MNTRPLGWLHGVDIVQVICGTIQREFYLAAFESKMSYSRLDKARWAGAWPQPACQGQQVDVTILLNGDGMRN